MFGGRSGRGLAVGALAGAVLLGLAPGAWAADTTSTAISCSPNPVVVSNNTTCTATVTDTTSGSTVPTGMVTFSGGTGGFSGSPCTLAASGANTATCSVTFTPSATGMQTLTATYNPNAGFTGSSNTTPLTVLAATSTVVACSPNPVGVGATTSCTATVTGNTTNGAPTGTVTFNNGGASGGFVAGNPCTLSSISTSASSCSVGYTPSAAGTQTIGGTYTPPGGSPYGSSFGAVTLSVTGSPPAPSISCTPNPVTVSSKTTCTASFTGNSGQGAPAGTVNWSNSGASGSFSPGSCTLSTVSSTASSCSVGYTPAATGTQSIAATYVPAPGSPYSTSAGSTKLTVNPPGTTPPQNTSLPTVSGSTIVGQTLGASPGTWSGSPPIAFFYQWQSCTASCSNIPGATASFYTLTDGDLGARIRVLVGAVGAGGNALSASGEVGPVLPTRGQIGSALLAALGLRGGASIGGILGHGGYLTSFHALQAGLLVISWFEESAVAGAAGSRHILIARCVGGFPAARSATLKVGLTPAGRALLKHSSRVRVLAKASFSPPGRGTIKSSRTITLRR